MINFTANKNNIYSYQDYKLGKNPFYIRDNLTQIEKKQHNLVILTNTIDNLTYKTKDTRKRTFKIGTLFRNFNRYLCNTGIKEVCRSTFYNYLSTLKNDIACVKHYKRKLGINKGSISIYTLKGSRKEVHNKINEYYDYISYDDDTENDIHKYSQLSTKNNIQHNNSNKFIIFNKYHFIKNLMIPNHSSLNIDCTIINENPKIDTRRDYRFIKIKDFNKAKRIENDIVINEKKVQEELENKLENLIRRLLNKQNYRKNKKINITSTRLNSLKENLKQTNEEFKNKIKIINPLM